MYVFQSGETALMMAAYKGHTESLKLLLKAQADLTNTNKVIVLLTVIGRYFNTWRVLC